MTGLLQSLVGVASNAIERVSASMATKNEQADQNAVEFSSLLALALNPSAQQQAAAPLEEGASELESSLEAGVDVSTESAVGGSEATAGSGLGQGVTGASAADAAGSSAAEIAAATATGAATTTDPNRVQRGVQGLDPEFRTRLERVQARMQSEFGHRVEITETVREQDRQNHLYEQGRSRPGPVVTWTRNSNHTLGRAADVLIDGSYDNPAGYRRLAQIAAEEGLRTLGPKDPGHVELPANGLGRSTGGRWAAAEQAIESAMPVERVAEAARANDPTRVARVAEVARVADVARVAEVARVGQVAYAARAAQAPRVTTDGRAAELATLAAEARQIGFGTDGIIPLRSRGGHTDGESTSNGEGNASGDSELFRPEPAILSRGSFADIASAVAPASGVSGAERVARIMAMQDGASSGPVNHMFLRLDNASGGEDRIRVDLRGSNVGATLEMGSAAEAERMSSRIGELQRALDKQGLTTETIQVRAASSASTADTVEMARAGVATAELEARGQSGSRGGSSDSAPQRDRAHEGRRDAPDQDPQDPRHRSSKEQQGKDTR